VKGYFGHAGNLGQHRASITEPDVAAMAATRVDGKTG